MPREARVVLASASPRRSLLLTQLQVAHQVWPAQIDEGRLPAETIEQCVQRLAAQKAQTVWSALRSELPVLGADTVVIVGGQMLGKPRDREDALRMLAALSGREHEVLSAVAVHTSKLQQVRLSRSLVRFRPLERAECEAYWDSGEPTDKAGAYAVQGRGAIFIESLQGSYSGVMGLPLFETAALLAAAGIAVLGAL